jgi:hypothetical protein
MTSSFKFILVHALGVFLLAACRSIEGEPQNHLASPSPIPSANPEATTQTNVAPSQVPDLATPVASQPAAGICGGFEGALVVITIYPDIPDPRCTIITPDQILKVVNSREETLQVSIANFEATIEPGGERIFNLPFGQYLAPGVHNVEVLPCCGAALWLQTGQ